MLDLSFDLETLDVRPSTKIVSIGGAFFNIKTGHIGETFYYPVSLEGQEFRTMSASTLKWWMGQTEDARKVFNDPLAIPLHMQLDKLAKDIQTTTRVWGMGLYSISAY